MAKRYSLSLIFSSAFTIHLCWMVSEECRTVISGRWMFKLAISTSMCSETTCMLFRSFSTFSSICRPMLTFVGANLVLVPTVEALFPTLAFLSSPAFWTLLDAIASIRAKAWVVLSLMTCLAFYCMSSCFFMVFRLAVIKSF